MRCLVINLHRSPDRLAHMYAQFKRFGAVFERVEAVDGKHLPDHVLNLQPPSDLWKRMGKSEIACFMSHRKCWAIIAGGADEFGAVFEDDVFLADAAGQFLTSDEWLPKQVSLLKIETFKQRTFIRRVSRVRIGRHTIHRLTSAHLGTGGYIISKHSAQALLDLSERELPCAVDHFMFGLLSPLMVRGSVHQIVPALCVQSVKIEDESIALQSTIRLKLSERKKGIKRKKLSFGQKTYREIKRFSQQLAGIPTFLARYAGSKWIVVPFGGTSGKSD